MEVTVKKVPPPPTPPFVPLEVTIRLNTVDEVKFFTLLMDKSTTVPNALHNAGYIDGDGWGKVQSIMNIIHLQLQKKG